MSYTSQVLEMDHILRDIHKVDGLIATRPQGSDHPVFPYRDKRKRPVIWIEQASFQWLRGQKMITPHMRGFVLADSVTRRLKKGRARSAKPTAAPISPMRRVLPRTSIGAQRRLSGLRGAAGEKPGGAGSVRQSLRRERRSREIILAQVKGK